MIQRTQHIVIPMAKLYYNKRIKSKNQPRGKGQGVKMPSWWGKKLTVFVANDQIWACKWKIEIWNICLHHQEFDSVPYLNTFLIIFNVLTNVNMFFILYNKMHQYLGDLYNSREPIFSKQPMNNVMNSWTGKKIQSTRRTNQF